MSKHMVSVAKSIPKLLASHPRGCWGGAASTALLQTMNGGDGRNTPLCFSWQTSPRMAVPKTTVTNLPRHPLPEVSAAAVSTVHDVALHQHCYHKVAQLSPPVPNRFFIDPLKFRQELALEYEIRTLRKEIDQIFIQQGLQPFLQEHVAKFFTKAHAKRVQASRPVSAQSFARAVKLAVTKRKRISRQDKWALHDYTGPWYLRINTALRTGTTDKDTRLRIDETLRALCKISTKAYTGTVYRGIVLPLDTIQKDLVKGATFEEAGFMSTSTRRVPEFHKQPGPGKVFFEIDCRTGVSVKNFSKYKDEDEILFRPATLFMIKQVWAGACGETHVKMMEIH